MSQALYRKYRSRTLDEVVGQDHITSLLKRAIDNDNVTHAYLLTGPRGVGKTSVARIIAHQINQLSYDDESDHLDIIEIDAASNNSVDDIRDLRDKVYTAPSIASKKVYIIDEVHMLSKAAFNALLKTLEEPPSHVVFILATTDVEKLPATIISRVQQFNFRPIADDVIRNHLRSIAERESIDIDDQALELIAKHGGGSFRDSISLLDQMRHSAVDRETINPLHVHQALGTSQDDLIDQLIEAYRSQSIEQTIATVRQIEMAGNNATIVAKQLIERLQASLVDHPADIKLLDSLLEVGRSSYPYIKLLAAVANHIDEALTEPKEHHRQSTSSRPTSTPRSASRPTKPSSAPVATADKRESSDNTQPKLDANAKTSSSVELDWQTLLSTVDTPLKSLLAPSKHVQRGDTITIYAGTKFKANQLSSAKQQSKLQSALQKIGAADLTLDIRGEKAPPSDSQTAAVAAIMGGGEEVAYNG